MLLGEGKFQFLPLHLAAVSRPQLVSQQLFLKLPVVPKWRLRQSQAGPNNYGLGLMGLLRSDAVMGAGMMPARRWARRQPADLG